MSKITDQKTFSEKILHAKGLQIVRFCAVWSGPCHIMAPVYEEMTLLYHDKIAFYKVDIDEAPFLKSKFGITELPTILFYKEGIMAEHSIGLIPKELFIQKINHFISS